MNASRLLEHFDRISEAPDAIPRLRKFILDLAVRGKLVEQDAEEASPAPLTAEEYAAPRDGAIDFEFPTTWVVARVEDVADCRLGKMLDKGKNKGTPRRYLRNTNVRWFDFDLSDISEMRFEDSELDEFALRTGDVMVCEGGEPGRAAVWDEREDAIYFQKAIHRVRFHDGVIPTFFVRVIRQAADSGRLSAYFTGTGIKHLTGRGLGSFLFPLPPLAEQRRIVTKVDHLMGLCDRLEATREERERLRHAGTVLVLRVMVEGQAADVCLSRLDRLVIGSEQIGALKKAIVDLAVRGRLVEQRSAEQPAAADLMLRPKSRRKQTEQEKEETEQELPALPTAWRWVCIDDISANEPNAITDGPFGANLKTEHYVDNPGFRVVRLQNIGHGAFREEHRSFIERERFERLQKHRVFPGDLVVAGLVDPAVRCCMVPAELGPALVKADCYRFKVGPHSSSRFALYFLNSPLAESLATVHHHGMTLVRIGLGNFRRIPFPLPPLAEQDRIVARLDELMDLCDRLEEQLNSGRNVSGRLLGAVLGEALAIQQTIPARTFQRGGLDDGGHGTV